MVKLNALASPLDWWAPPNWQALDSSDADLGSSMPSLLPGGFLFQSGKDGNGYVLNGAGLGHVSSAAAEASGFCSGGSFGGSVYDPANSTVYAACASGLRALSLGSGSPPSLAAKAGFSAPSRATGPPMIAGGLVWVTNHSSGTLYGLDPTSGTTRSQFPIPENGSNVNHFASPSAGGGRLFVASGDQVTAYTIAQPPAPTNTTPSGGPHSPVTSHASISPRRFTATRAATLRLNLSEAATLTVAITELRDGHVVGHRCSSKVHRGKSCPVRATLVRLHFHARAGRKAFKLSLRQLAAGRYTAFVYAANHAGRRSRTIRITFTILRAQR